jgi:hypothetical protein
MARGALGEGGPAGGQGNAARQRLRPTPGWRKRPRSSNDRARAAAVANAGCGVSSSRSERREAAPPAPRLPCPLRFRPPPAGVSPRRTPAQTRARGPSPAQPNHPLPLHPRTGGHGPSCRWMLPGRQCRCLLAEQRRDAARQRRGARGSPNGMVSGRRSDDGTRPASQRPRRRKGLLGRNEGSEARGGPLVGWRAARRCPQGGQAPDIEKQRRMKKTAVQTTPRAFRKNG